VEEKYAGRKWFYDWRELDRRFEETEVQSLVERYSEQYANQTNHWNNELHSEWTCRMFLAAKLIMSATLHVNSAHFAFEGNNRVVVPYLRYYAALCLMRALCLTLPHVRWDDGKLITISHKAAIRETTEYIRRLNGVSSNSINAQIRELKAERELLSYRAPSVGDDQVTEKNHEFESLLVLLAECAQLNSEVFEQSLSKRIAGRNFELLEDYAYKVMSVELEGTFYDDNEDAYRFGRMIRKNTSPCNLMFMMQEGHVDDFFGAWKDENDRAGVFDPDSMTGIIFDIP